MEADGKAGYVVTLSGERPPHEVALELAQKGFEVGDVLGAIGVVTGTAHPAAMPNLRAIAGVADVSRDHDVHIGPPGAEIS